MSQQQKLDEWPVCNLLPETLSVIFGVGLVVSCLVAFAFTLDFVRRLYPEPHGVQIAIIILAAVTLLIVFVVTTLLIAIRTFVKAKNIYSDITLPHVAVADLPAPKSLLRASQEPLQAQKTVLLRAVTQKQNQHKEQVLRASSGKKKPL